MVEEKFLQGFAKPAQIEEGGEAAKVRAQGGAATWGARAATCHPFGVPLGPFK